MRLRLLPPDFPMPAWLPYSWLCYTSMYVACAFVGRHELPWLWWGGHVLALAVFLGLYFRGYWLRGRRLIRVVAGITAVGLVMAPWNPGSSAFFIFAAAHAGETGRPSLAVRVLAGVVLAAGIEAWLANLPAITWVPSVSLALLVGGANVAFAEKRRADGRLRLAQHEVEHLAKVAERERIARDLHDLLGHTLSLIVLKAELASKLSARDPERAAAEIREVERISRDALSEVRSAVRGYRQLTMDESIAQARQALDAAGVRLDTRVEPVDLDPRVEGVVSLVVREAVTNILRHARATSCRIELHPHAAGRFLLTVADDGVGGSGGEGFGLAGMRERVEGIGGRFDYDGRAGAVLTVELPARRAATPTEGADAA